MTTEERIKQLEDKVAYLSGQIDTILELSKDKETSRSPSIADDDSFNIDEDAVVMEALRNFELPSIRRKRLEAKLAEDKSKHVIHSKASLNASLEESDGQLAS